MQQVTPLSTGQHRVFRINFMTESQGAQSHPIPIPSLLLNILTMLRKFEKIDPHLMKL